MKKLALSSGLKRKTILSKIFYGLFIAFAAAALISSSRDEQTSASGFNASLRTAGLDTVFAIDVSRSMDIRDIAGAGNHAVSRLERGLAVAKEGASFLTGSRIAAVIGRGAGYLTVPLTYDNEAALNFLDSLDSRMATGRSTNLQSLLETAAGAFPETTAAKKIIILISDGESHFGVLKNAVNNCIKENIAVIAVGVGSDEGAPVPAEDPAAAAPISSRDAQTLRMIAERTGGIYIDGNREDAGSILISHLRDANLNPAGIPGRDKQNAPKRPSRRLFVLLAGISYGVSKFTLRTIVRKRSLKLPLAIAVFILFSSCSEGKLLLIEANYLFSRGRYDEAVIPYYKALGHEDSAPYAEYGLGLAYQTMDEGLAALNYYAASREKIKNDSDRQGQAHRELIYRNYYNSGIIYFEEGDYTAAAAAFKEALKADSSKTEAKRNLEISLMVIARDTSRNRQQEIDNETKELLFQIIQEQEQQNWKSGEWTEERFLGPDY